jgi:hypothetical protein
MKNYVLIAFAGVAAYYFLVKKQFVEKTKLIFKKIRFAGKKFEITFLVNNPTNQSGKISAINGEVYLGEKLIADFSSFNDQVISKRSSSEIKIIASPNIGILQLITSKGWLQKGLKYTIKGNANVDGLIIPFENKANLI